MPVDEGGEIDANVTVDEATAAAAYAAALEAPWRTEMLDELLDKFRVSGDQDEPIAANPDPATTEPARGASGKDTRDLIGTGSPLGKEKKGRQREDEPSSADQGVGKKPKTVASTQEKKAEAAKLAQELISQGWKHFAHDVWETLRPPPEDTKAKKPHDTHIFKRFEWRDGKPVALRFENTDGSGNYKHGFSRKHLITVPAVNRYFQQIGKQHAMFEAIPSDDLDLLLEDEQKDVFEHGEMILAAVSQGFASFTPQRETGTDAQAQDRINAFTYLAEALRRWFEVYRRIRDEMRVMGPVKLSEDLLGMNSRYRKTVLELRRVTDMLQLCRSPEPFPSWGADRCWPSPGSGRPGYYATVHLPGLNYFLHSLQLVEKISKDVDKHAAQETLSKMTSVDEKTGITSFADFPPLQTSHLCIPERGGSKACYNPAHLVAETQGENNARAGCLGTIWIDDIPYNACVHGRDGRDRCVGWLQTPPDTQLSQPQRSYIPSFVTRDKHAELFAPLIASEQAAPAAPAAPAAAPVPAAAPAAHGRGSRRPTNLERILDRA